jgi:hypothetical protein
MVPGWEGRLMSVVKDAAEAKSGTPDEGALENICRDTWPEVLVVFVA